jgi:AraC-like DNA-binding protein
MAARSTPLNNYPVLHSRNPEFARDRLFSNFGATAFGVAAAGDTFAVHANHLQIGGLGLSYCDYAGDVSLGFGEASFVRQLFNISGVGSYRAGGPSGEIATGSWSSILPAHEPVKLDVRSGYRQLVLRIEIDVLRRYLGALLGQEIGKELHFERATYPPSMNSLRRRIFQFATDFNERGDYFSDLAAAEVERMVIMNFLMCHRHNYTHLLQRQPLPVAPSSVRTVEEYIEANWDKAVDIEVMATVAGISARSLFRQFKKERGYSPAEFAKRIRLDRARELLEQSSLDASVTRIALKCGFQNPGHFARDFRLTFGELPSETLRKSVRRSNS